MSEFQSKCGLRIIVVTKTDSFWVVIFLTNRVTKEYREKLSKESSQICEKVMNRIYAQRLLLLHLLIEASFFSS